MEKNLINLNFKNENLSFSKKIVKNNKQKCLKILNYSFKNFEYKIELSLNLINSLEMKKLNNKFRKKDKTTDVLSFTNKNWDLSVLDLGDIFINVDYLIKSSNPNKLFVNFFIHSFLHLLGFDHKNEKDYQTMELVHQYLLEI